MQNRRVLLEKSGFNKESTEAYIVHTVLSKITSLAYKKKGKRKDCLKGNAYSLRRCLQSKYVISKIILFLDEAE